VAVECATQLPPLRSDDTAAAGPPLLICQTTSVRLVHSWSPYLEVIPLSATWEAVSRQLGPSYRLIITNLPYWIHRLQTIFLFFLHSLM